MNITSVAALDFVDLLTTIHEVIDRSLDSREFLSRLHDSGFMIVPIPPPAIWPVEPPPPAVEPTPKAIDPRFRTATKADYSFDDWLTLFRVNGLPSGIISDADLRTRYEAGETPQAALDDNIPF